MPDGEKTGTTQPTSGNGPKSPVQPGDIGNVYLGWRENDGHPVPPRDEEFPRGPPHFGHGCPPFHSPFSP